MKILIVGPRGDGYLPLSYARALEALGKEIAWFDILGRHFGSAYYRRNRIFRRILRGRRWEEMNRDLFDTVNEVSPDLVLAFKAPFLNPETIRKIETKIDIPVANYYPDNPYCGVPFLPNRTSAQRRDILHCLRACTRVFIWSRPLAEQLEKDGVSVAYLPFGVDAHAYHPSPRDVDPRFKERHGVVFIGQHNRKRDRHLRAIERHRARIWHPSWQRASGALKRWHEIREEEPVGRECASIYSNAEIALNIVDDLNMPGHNMRTFEIPACGGAVMVSTYTREQDEFFPEGEAACYYRDPSELDGIIERLLGDPDHRDKIRTNALRIARDHTYEQRAGEMLKILGFAA